MGYKIKSAVLKIYSNIENNSLILASSVLWDIIILNSISLKYKGKFWEGIIL